MGKESKDEGTSSMEPRQKANNESNNENLSKHQRQSGDNEQDEEEEEFSQDFQCSICLDLLHKPVVLGCGHLACFWCVYKAMNFWHESHCPICRHPYNHFPSACQLLHFLLLKMYPIAYKRRERQVGEEEKEVGYFSPQFDNHLFGSHSNRELDGSSNFLQTKLCSDSCFAGQRESFTTGNQPGATVHTERNMESMPSASTGSSKDNTCLIAKEPEHGNQKQVSAADLLCAECKKLLCRPVVLNCGHVYCEFCISIPTEGFPRCQTCESVHPNGFPTVCLVLEHFLEEHFPEPYAERQESLLKQADCSIKSQQPAGRSLSVPTSVYTSWLFGKGPNVHVGVGCDSCGMCPIVGVRYRCKDCVEKIGFDLCETCYNNPPKLGGRFNQQHTPEHIFEIVQPRSIRELVRGLNLELVDEEGSHVLEDHEGSSLAPISSHDVPMTVEAGSSDVQDGFSTLSSSGHNVADREDDSGAES